jgi:hypothetical protein
LDPGFLEHLRLSPRAVIGSGARLLEFLLRGPHVDDATLEEEMELLHRRCCGLDVHKETVVACLRLVADGKVTTEVRTFQAGRIVSRAADIVAQALSVVDILISSKTAEHRLP